MTSRLEREREKEKERERERGKKERKRKGKSWISTENHKHLPMDMISFLFGGKKMLRPARHKKIKNTKNQMNI